MIARLAGPRGLRRRAPLAVGLAVALLAAACGGSSPAKGGDAATPETVAASNGCDLAPVSTTSVPPDPIEIRVWEPYQGRTATALERVVDRYNASQNRVKVVLDAVAGMDAEQARFDAAAATPANLPTVVVLDAGRTQATADSGLVVPASTCVKSIEDDTTSPLPSVRSAYTVAGQRLAGATTLETPMLYINRAHFTRAGLDPEHPPRTLKELADAATKLKAAGVSSRPLALPLRPSLVENWLTGAGSPVVDHDNGRSALATASAFDNPRTVELFQWLHDADAAGLLDPVGPTVSDVTALGDLVNQTSSMAIAPASSIGAVDAYVDGRGDAASLGLSPDTTVAGATTGELDVTPLPGLDGPGRGQVAGSAWYVTTTATPDQRAAAWDFLRVLGAVDAQVHLNLEASIPPSNTKAVDDNALQAVWTKTRRGHWLDTAYTQVTNFDPQAPGPLIGPSDQVDAAIAAALAAVMTGPAPGSETSPTTASTEASSKPSPLVTGAVATADAAITAAVSAYAKAHPAH